MGEENQKNSVDKFFQGDLEEATKHENSSKAIFMAIILICIIVLIVFFWMFYVIFHLAT